VRVYRGEGGASGNRPTGDVGAGNLGEVAAGEMPAGDCGIESGSDAGREHAGEGIPEEAVLAEAVVSEARSKWIGRESMSPSCAWRSTVGCMPSADSGVELNPPCSLKSKPLRWSAAAGPRSIKCVRESLEPGGLAR